MGKFSKQTFLQGAVILGFTNLLVKIFGAIFKIPLRRLIGADGMGIFTQAYVIYVWLFVIATAGMPVAISKMVSESNARGNENDARKIFLVSFGLLNFIGIIGMLILFFGADQFSIWLRDPKVALSIKAVSPSLWFVAIMSAFRGYFQGQQNMIPTALSELAEVSGKLFMGYFLAAYWISRGIEYAGAGAMLGVTSGTVFGALLLFAIYKSSNIRMGKSISSKRSVGSILSELIRIAVPITIGASVFSLTNVIDMAMIKYRLQMIGYSVQESRTLYGYYSNDAVTLFNLPATLVVALAVSIVPAIARAYTLNNLKSVKRTTEAALRMTILFSLPCAIGLSVLSGPILQLVYNDSGANILLRILGLAVFFVSIVLVTNAILQSTGKVYVPVKNMLIGGLVKIIANYFLVGYPPIHINGAPIGTILCYLTIVILNMIEVKKVTKAKYSFLDFYLKPIVSVIAMGIVVLYVYLKLFNIINSNSIATIVSIAIGAFIYGTMLLAVGAFKESDFNMLPKGKTIYRILKKYHLIK